MTTKTVIRLLLAIALAPLQNALAQNADQSRITVAAAANLTQVAKVLEQQFALKTGIHAAFSFGSTAQLTQQVENGAPFDVILAADSEHVRELERKGFLASGSRAAYANGVLALWAPSAGLAVRGPADLTSPRVHVIAVAKPELAPYGAAAMETLRNAGILASVQSKIVYSDNINMAKQYGASGNADAVFTAYSLVLKERGTVIRIDEKAHSPIVQELGIIAASTHKGDAMKFVDFVLRGSGRSILTEFGYQPTGKGH
jgi:molybdate transport system substrate-binding protein